MKATAVATTLTFVGYSLASLLVNTPAQLVTCQPALLTWEGGVAPYFISILPGGEVGAAPLESFPTQLGDSYTWEVNIAAGTSITIEVRDSTGSVQFSAPDEIQAGHDTSCVGK